MKHEWKFPSTWITLPVDSLEGVEELAFKAGDELMSRFVQVLTVRN